jgi:hypothetical protein
VNLLRVAKAELEHLKPERVSASRRRRRPPPPLRALSPAAAPAAAPQRAHASAAATPFAQAVYQRVGNLLFRSDRERASKSVAGAAARRKPSERALAQAGLSSLPLGSPPRSLRHRPPRSRRPSSAPRRAPLRPTPPRPARAPADKLAAATAQLERLTGGRPGASG